MTSRRLLSPALLVLAPSIIGVPEPSVALQAPIRFDDGASAVAKEVQDSRRPVLPAFIRVGLETDSEEIVVPAGVRLVARDRSFFSDRPVRVRPAQQMGALGVYRLQVAALKGETLAATLVERLHSKEQGPADTVFDAGSDLYKVRTGDYRTREEAEQAKASLAELGLSGAWIVHEDRGLSKAGLVVVTSKGEVSMPGRWLALETSNGVVHQGRESYRGRLLVYLNDRGKLNLINELAFESYLRGVVPRELGPELYPELEALKAQSVAARTYTLRNLGGFEDEGFDICATPRCQVYGGLGVEHPMSDRAIEETRGVVVVYQGEPAETLYSATCGGHTEDVEVIFPAKKAEYLRGVSCLESGAHALGSSEAKLPLESGVVELLLPGSRGARGKQRLEAQLVELAARAGLAQPRDRLRSSARTEVLRYVGSIFDLALDPRTLTSIRKLSALVERPPADWSPVEVVLATRLVGTDAEARREPLSPLDGDRLAYAMAIYLGLLVDQEAQFRSLGRGAMTVRVDLSERKLRLAEEAVSYRGPRLEEQPVPVKLVAGDPVRLLMSGEQVLAVVQERRQQRSFRARLNRSHWTRYRSDTQLAEAVRRYYPGFEYRSFEILERGVSGRVGRLELRGSGDELIEVEGLAIRWIFDLPDNLFEAQRVAEAPQGPGWRFVGRGWGHGVGMCQLGAVGMAARDLNYSQILRHYYTGVELHRGHVVARELPGPLVVPVLE